MKKSVLKLGLKNLFSAITVSICVIFNIFGSFAQAKISKDTKIAIYSGLFGAGAVTICALSQSNLKTQSRNFRNISGFIQNPPSLPPEAATPPPSAPAQVCSSGKIVISDRGKGTTGNNGNFERYMRTATEEVEDPFIKKNITRQNFWEGGSLGRYMKMSELAANAKDKIEIRGTCQSACIFFLSYIPRERICIDRNAIFRFHRGRVPGIIERRVGGRVERKVGLVTMGLKESQADDAQYLPPYLLKIAQRHPTVGNQLFTEANNTELSREFPTCGSTQDICAQK